MYPEEMIRPMRQELTNIGFREMRSPEDVDNVLKQQKGTVLVVVNSICGCAAGRARPAVAKALTNSARPEVLTTVFAGQDREATDRAGAISRVTLRHRLLLPCCVTGKSFSCWNEIKSKAAIPFRLHAILLARLTVSARRLVLERSESRIVARSSSGFISGLWLPAAEGKSYSFRTARLGGPRAFADSE